MWQHLSDPCIRLCLHRCRFLYCHVRVHTCRLETTQSSPQRNKEQSAPCHWRSAEHTPLLKNSSFLDGDQPPKALPGPLTASSLGCTRTKPQTPGSLLSWLCSCCPPPVMGPHTSAEITESFFKSQSRRGLLQEAFPDLTAPLKP